jgi:hypothetical protein
MFCGPLTNDHVLVLMKRRLFGGVPVSVTVDAETLVNDEGLAAPVCENAAFPRKSVMNKNRRNLF